MKAQTCPKCDGWRDVPRRYATGTAIDKVQCPVCWGMGYLLVPDPLSWTFDAPPVDNMGTVGKKWEGNW